MIQSLCETNETTLLMAWQAGRDYERRNRPQAPVMTLGVVARSTGWHGELCAFWIAGAAGERRRNARGGI